MQSLLYEIITGLRMVEPGSASSSSAPCITDGNSKNLFDLCSLQACFFKVIVHTISYSTPNKVEGIAILALFSQHRGIYSMYLYIANALQDQASL